MKKIVRLVMLAALLSFVIYPLAYAPAYRLLVGSDADARPVLDPYEDRHDGPDRRLPDWAAFAFRPVTEIIDWIPLASPLLFWADFWGVRDQVESDSFVRDYKGMTWMNFDRRRKLRRMFFLYFRG